MKEKEVKKCRTFIGGQALMEGVMMQGATSMAMAVRTEDGDILTETKRTGGKKWYFKVPIVRGVVAFISSLVRGTGTILRSSEVIYPEEETPSKGAYAFSAVLGVVLAIAMFMLLPSFLTSLFDKYILKSLHLFPRQEAIFNDYIKGSKNFEQLAEDFSRCF